MVRSKFLAETLFLMVIVFSLLITGCNSKKRSEEIKNYAYQDEGAGTGSSSGTAVRLASKPWVEEDLVCYGLVVGIDEHGRFLSGLPIKARVLTIRADSMKMKALETVSLTQVKGCSKMGLTKGDTWWESEGDVFKTREEATAWLKGKGILFGQEKNPQPVAK